ncbi:hypothetical protein B9Z55_014199 [Caenorhabditis nigoni]|uniref:Uncharacterized protein n=1 Tax=Caenorhabditis nigoni TaxID=1611254 RepID=A0A2G5U4X4_9PELO|nr:hypothetical protein B9Z55_014199 [Caenorhabditis nigoni]
MIGVDVRKRRHFLIYSKDTILRNGKRKRRGERGIKNAMMCNLEAVSLNFTAISSPSVRLSGISFITRRRQRLQINVFVLGGLFFVLHRKMSLC